MKFGVDWPVLKAARILAVVRSAVVKLASAACTSITVWKPIAAGESRVMLAGAYFFSDRQVLVGVGRARSRVVDRAGEVEAVRAAWRPAIAGGDVHGSMPIRIALLPSCLSEFRMFGQAAGALM